MSKHHVTALVALVAATWGVIALVQGIPLASDLWKPFSLVTTVILGAIQVYDRWAWQWLPRWFVDRPDLRGTWAVIVRSSYGATGEDAAREISGFLVVRQTSQSLSLRLLTEEGSSATVSATIGKASDGLCSLSAV